MTDAWTYRARRVRAAIFDVDGVLTDGTLFVSGNGDETKGFHIRDGLGLKMLQHTGIQVALLTGRRSGCVEVRSRELGIVHTIQGSSDKREGFATLLGELGVAAEEAAYMGDDLIDLPVLRRCGFAVTVADAPDVVKANVHYTTNLPGGRGAVREFCELVMHAQGTYADSVARYLA